MNAREFSQLAESLLGAGWRPTLARMLRVNTRTVQRWGNGQNAIPSQVADALERIHAIASDVWQKTD